MTHMRLVALSLLLNDFGFLRFQNLLNFDFIFAPSFLGWHSTFPHLLYLPPRSWLLVLPFSIINRKEPFFSYFVCYFLRTNVTIRSV